jgi:hypothetical protein
MGAEILIAGRMPPNVIPQLKESFTVHLLPAERPAMGQLVVDNLHAYFRGKPLLTPAV